MHIKVERWILLGIEVLVSIPYITFDYGEIPFDNLYLISVYIGQIVQYYAMYWVSNPIEFIQTVARQDYYWIDQRHLVEKYQQNIILQTVSDFRCTKSPLV
jgi:hypothetical protein